MEDENTKEENQPSTSKKESQRTNSGNDLYDDRGHDDRATNSETSVSATYSVSSRIEMADARPEVPKPTLGKREAKPPERKKKRRNVGRVEKRRRSFTRRQLRRAPPKRKPRVVKEERKDRDLSVSTIFTRLSSRSGSRTPGCIHCGHRCCRRRAKRFVVRYETEQRRIEKIRRYRFKKHVKKRIVKSKKMKKRPALKMFARQFRPTAAISQGSKLIQIGSRSHMLSPLFVDTNYSLVGKQAMLPQQMYCEVTPEMIFEALRVLTLWRQNVQTASIVEYCKRNYPVNVLDAELLKEMKEKLRIAALVGIVIQTSEDLWTLTCELQQRNLNANHVTLFWKAYGDTLSPVARKNVEPNPNERPKEKNVTQYNERGFDVYDGYI